MKTNENKRQKITNKDNTDKYQSSYPSGNRKSPVLLSVRQSVLSMRLTSHVTCGKMAAVQFAVGRDFFSFKKLEAEVKAYQTKRFVQFVKRNTK